MILGKYIKQPSEVSDYDIDFSHWLRSGEVLMSSNATIEVMTDESPGTLVLVDVEIALTAIRIRLSGGADGHIYKVTALTESASGRIDESEFVVKVKEY